MRSVPSSTHTASPKRALTEREQVVLRSVVMSFIQTADPVSSRTLAKHFVPGLSAATIRNTMSDLEEWGFLAHPYTSAGRVPTDQGYRTFVDELMPAVHLTPNEKLLLREELISLEQDTERLLRETTKLLGRLSSLLAIALTPKLSKGVLHRLEVVPLSSSRAMFVVNVEGGLVKTIILEMQSELSRLSLDRVVGLLNERLSGLTLEEIRRTFAQRLHDLSDADPTGVIKLVMQKADRLFNELPEEKRVQMGGAMQLVQHPEFREPDQVQRIVELVENQEIVVQLLEQQHRLTEINPKTVRITIGGEIGQERAGSYSLVTANYRILDSVGTISLIGPRRMDYGRAVALIEYVSKLLSQS